MTLEELKQEFDVKKAPGGLIIKKWRGKGSRCVIPDGVIGIDDDAFWSCKNLQEITIPNSVTSIGEAAFFSCSGLKEIIIPNSVTSIGKCAFQHCSNLAKLTLPSSITSIGSAAFDDCSSLTEIVVPDSVTSIENFAFRGCSGITVYIGSGLQEFNALAFEYNHFMDFRVSEQNPALSAIDGVLFNKDKTELLCYPHGKQSEYVIPDGVTSIGEAAFCGCGMTKITLPDTVKSIGERAFEHCNMTEIAISNGVTSIGDKAFSWCDNLTEIAIPDSVTSIGEFAFSQCVSLTAVRLPHKLKELNDYTFSRCTKLKTVELPNSLRKIKMWAFQDCESLSQITFPEKLKTIGWQAFHGCKSLEKVILPPGVKTSRNSFDEHTAVAISEADISEVDTSATQEVIEKKAFAGSDITSLEVKEGIKKIKEQAYKGCKALKTVSLPRSLTDLGSCVFDGCQMLSSVTHHGDSLIKIGKNAFRGTRFEKEYSKDVKSTSSPCTLSEETMVCLGSTLLFCQVNTEEVIIPAGIEGIAPFAFRKCPQLKRVSVPQTVKWIAKEAFVPDGEKSPSPSLEIYAAVGSAAEKHALKELAFFVPIPPEKAADGHVFEEYKLVKDTEYKKQYFSHLHQRAESEMTSAARYKVICEYQQAISDDGDDIFVEETEVRRLFADPDFLGLFYDWEQRAIKQKSGIFVKKDRIIPSEVAASFLVKLLAALVAFSESPVKATIGLNKDKWEYRGDYGSSSKLYVGIGQCGRVYARLERQESWDM